MEASTSKYKEEWQHLLSYNREILRNLAFDGELKCSKFRSVCWSLLLRVLSENSNDWKEQRQKQRQKYEKLKNEFVKNPHNPNVDANDDPLSQSKQSIWNQYFGDQELFAVIKQDVIRTFPGVEFFRKPIVQESMTNILFYYAREHPYMCYRQGMHEILAPILFVMHSDHQALSHFKEISNHDFDDKLLDVLNVEYLEADAYSLFSRLMSLIESYYRIVNMVPTSEGYFPIQNGQILPDDSVAANECEVIGQLNFIRDKILIKEDLHLHNHFLKLDIPLHIFGIRWLRLLFGREFPLQDLLILWDAIFADSDRFELPNFILVAMLIRIRDRLLSSNYTACLTFLMKYPNNIDIGLILRYALHMQMPQKFSRPNEAFIYVKLKSENGQQQIRNDNLHLSRQQSLKRSGKLFGTVRNRSSSLTDTNSSVIKKNLQEVKSVFNTDGPLNETQIQKTDLKIIEGYREHSSEALHAELRLAQNIMSISKQKLQKYLYIIRQNLPSTHNYPDELNQSLSGIEELCSLLDVKFLELNEPVDSASEAAEAAAQIKEDKKSSNDQQPLSLAISMGYTPIEASEIDDSSFTTANFSSYLNEPFTNSLRTRYEIPDNSFMKNSSKLLGNKKDVELKLFKSEYLGNKSESVDLPIPDPLGIRE